MIEVKNTTTGEVLFRSKDSANISITVGGRDRAILTVNNENVGVYLRDMIRDRAEITTRRSRFGYYVRMGV